MLSDVANHLNLGTSPIEDEDERSVCAAKLMLSYLYRQPRAAIEAAEQYLRFEPDSSAMVGSAEHGFYYPLALLAAYSDMSSEQQTEFRKLLPELIAQAKYWADAYPENFASRYLLIQAEMARVDERHYEAMELYDKALASAYDHDLTNQVALVNELAGRFYHNQGRDKLAGVYLMDAWRAYRQWGAQGKAAHLEQEFAVYLGSSRAESVACELQVKAHQTDTTQAIAEVMHNVGSILNSVVTSIAVLERLAKRASYRKLVKANRMLSQNRDRLERFLLHENKGPLLLEYYSEIEALLASEASQLTEELDCLAECVTLIRDAFQVQQDDSAAACTAEQPDL